ncbi:serine/threonine protein kinase, CMGC, dual-specificity, partial [Elasticomyces elasticus]
MPLFLQMPELSMLPPMTDRKISMCSTIPAPTRKVSGAGAVSLSRKNSTASATGRAYLPKPDVFNTSSANPATVIRGRRQSHFPPNAFNNPGSTQPAKAPRKSVGPCTFTPLENTEVQVRRNPSAAGRKFSNESQRSARLGKVQTQNMTNGQSEETNSPQRAKTKSTLTSSKSLTKDVFTPSRTPDPTKFAASNGQVTPGKRSGTPGRPASPGSKRMSVAPGHATGLGARTISPTDARRMKRISMMPAAPPVPNRRISQAPPTPQPDPALMRPRSTVQSPAMPNRKNTHTPSSSRTTPDPNRKSYSSGQSLSSSTSYNSGKPVNNTIHRQSLNISSSRLTTPKPNPEVIPRHGEEIPPVPAIPKSYDSPASEIDQPFFSARNSALQAVDTPLSDDPVALDLANAMAMLGLPDPLESHALARVSPPGYDQPAYPEASYTARSNRINKSNLNLRLPPMNLQPMSTHIASTHHMDDSMLVMPQTPPGVRGLKTPSTPMTASKATFFSKNRTIEDQQNALRSSTSHYALRHDNSMFDPNAVALPPFQFEADGVSARSMSPYISSSLPKDNNEFGGLMRNTFNTELKRNGTLQKPNGPRAPSYSINTPTTDQSGSNTPHTAVNTSTVSLQRERSESKLVDVPEDASHAARYNNMPPPKLPASATWSNLSPKASASSTHDPTLFQTRRKISASNGNLFESAESAASIMTHGAAARPSMDSVRSSIMTHTNRSGSILGQVPSGATSKPLLPLPTEENVLDNDDLAAEEEMHKLASKRRDLEAAARKLDSLRARAKPLKRVSANAARQVADLNIYERGEIVDYLDVYFTGTRTAKKVVGDPSSASTNFGYDDERGDYNIVEGDHISYRYEVIDILGKGSFGQVVRCIDHKI